MESKKTLLPALRPEVGDRLEKAVMEVFSHSDFHRANIRDVAKVAGVSLNTIYKHFGSKEQLVFTYVNIWLGRLTNRIIDHLQGIEDLKEKLRKVLWLQLDYYERHSYLGRMLFMTLPMATWMADKTFEQKKNDPPLPGSSEKGPARGCPQSTCSVWGSAGHDDGTGATFVFHVGSAGMQGEPCRPKQCLVRHDLASYFHAWQGVSNDEKSVATKI